MECRERVMNYTKKFLIEVENKLNNIAKELKRIFQLNNNFQYLLTEFWLLYHLAKVRT
jgi:hypothetical protein